MLEEVHEEVHPGVRQQSKKHCIRKPNGRAQRGGPSQGPGRGLPDCRPLRLRGPSGRERRQVFGAQAHVMQRILHHADSMQHPKHRPIRLHDLVDVIDHRLPRLHGAFDDAVHVATAQDKPRRPHEVSAQHAEGAQGRPIGDGVPVRDGARGGLPDDALGVRQGLVVGLGHVVALQQPLQPQRHLLYESDDFLAPIWPIQGGVLLVVATELGPAVAHLNAREELEDGPSARQYLPNLEVLDASTDPSRRGV
mmetsp:Transcript_138838/g.443236  ORF Transcript_138838/g.443236 Transcript_138838/m.443236 type:complete len:251 (-) Transcript_138838:329-1081(-)